MRLMNLFDRKKKRTVLVVQCRLSSTRLPRKALLPLGGRTVLEWVLDSMKKVPADSRYLAVDTDSAAELEGIARACGYEFFAGSKEDVLDRFCKVIEISKADVVIRATADNPFLFYEAAQDLLEEYKDRSSAAQVDYITWQGLPHGSGVEIFDAHSLLLAAAQTEQPYDHEHVGPALYNHKENFNCLFIRAPRKFYHPELRTTIDEHGDYRRAQALVRAVSGDSPVTAPYTVQQILDGLSRNDVCHPVLFVPSVRKGRGTGHLRRCLDLALKTGGDILIPVDADLPQCDALVAEAQEHGLQPYQLVRDISHASQYCAAVTDLFVTDAAFAKKLSELCPVIALDEGASSTDYADYLLDIIPSVSANRRTNLTEPGFIELGSHTRSADRSKAPATALVVLGGEDPAGLTVPAAEALASCGLEVTAVASSPDGVQELAEKIPEDARSRVKVCAPIPGLRDKLYEYDLVVSHYGFTAFEAAAAGCAVILLGTTPLHEQLARMYGFACIGSGEISAKVCRKLLSAPEKLYRSMEDGVPRQRSLADFTVALSRGKKILCPVCRQPAAGKDPVVARTAEHTFRRCHSCGMLYMAWTLESEQTVYNHDYFYDDYKKQYGKTYEDDFDSIKAECVRRTSIIDYLYRRVHSPVTPTVLDIGCALGPFLDAANDSGWQVFGTDISADAVRYVQETLHFPAVCAAFPHADVTSEFGIDKFDAVTMWYVIEHFQNLDEVLSAVAGLLKKGGIFAFSTPSASGVSARYNTDTFFAQSPSDHYTLWEPSRTASILKKYGFEVQRIVSTGIHPERFPCARQKDWSAKSVQYRALRTASRVMKLGDTFEVYCKKL